MFNKIISGLLLSLLIATFSSLQAQMVTVNPNEYSGALKNPFKGFRPGFTSTSTPSNWNEDDYPTLYRHYIPWNVIEDDESDTIDKIRDFCNTSWAGCEAANVKIVPRVYLMYGDGQFYFPSDLPNNVWDSQKLRDRVIRMIRRLGQLWDTDPRVAWVQTGIIGKWGEQESPVGVDEPIVDPDNSSWVEIMGQEFEAAFPNKMLVVRNQIYWTDEGFTEMGVFWDSFAHKGQYSGSWTQIKEHNAMGRYLIAPVEGEIAYNWGSGPDDYGSTPTETVSTPLYYNFVINTIKQLHCAALGWVSGYDHNSTTEEGAKLMQKAFGYRFVINEFSCSARTEPGGTLDISFKVKNEGSAPMYEKWPLAFVLIDTSTKQFAWTATLPGNDITTWLPGDNFDWDPESNPGGSKIYTTPAQEYVINSSVTIPGDFVTGQYMAGITILEPYSQTPGLFFAIENFLAESQTQPLCRIGIGEDVMGGHELDPTIFDDPFNDDNRSYSLEWSGATYTLTTNATAGGSVTPSGSGDYPENRNVRLEATGSLGYEFSNWSGDLSGSTNPVVITMDADKNITANFISVPTYTLTANAANGSIALDPAGGTYNEGTVVTLTVSADLGYIFSGWSGDLSGSENPATITMDGDKNITANFISAPIYTLTTSAEGGSIVLEPAGPKYTEGTVVKLTAIANVDYVFTGWSGDTLDGYVWENPNYMTMDEDKNITANFVGPPEETGLWVETFNLPDGTISDSGSTAWTATRSSGVFEVIDDRLAINDAGPEGVFSTEKIDISSGSVDVSVMVEGAGGLDPQNSANEDWFGIYKKVDGGAEELIYETYGAQSARTVTETGITGDTLEIVIKGYTTAGDEFYYFDNLKVTYSNPSNIDEANIILPLSTQLFQNYPNPFNPETTISYQLSASAQVRLVIFNALGQRMSTLVEKNQPAGQHSVKWNAKDDNGMDVASGIYLYRLETKDFVQVKKLILIR